MGISIYRRLSVLKAAVLKWSESLLAGKIIDDARNTIGALESDRDQLLRDNGMLHAECGRHRQRVAELEAEVERLRAAVPDDLRQHGWSVAVHNDYRQHGENCTFWLLTKGDRAIKGEGPTDAAALNEIRELLLAKAKEVDGE